MPDRATTPIKQLPQRYEAAEGLATTARYPVRLSPTLASRNKSRIALVGNALASRFPSGSASAGSGK